MNMHQVIAKINHYCDELEFAYARKYIENNLSRLKEKRYYNALNENAKVLFNVINQEADTMKENGLTKLDLLKINEINKYCSNFDIPMLKRTLKENLDLLYREEVYKYLNDNAKYILNAMGIILTGNKEIKEVVSSYVS